MDAVAVFLEIRQRMQKALLIIRGIKPESCPIDITVMPSWVELTTRQVCKAINFPPEVRIVPSSCRGLQYVPADGLHMRLLAQADLNTKLVSFGHDVLKSNKSYTFYCQSCGNRVINNRRFLRVLSLPSENWTDLVEEWCCHPSPFSDSLLQPQRDDCLLGHNYFLVTSENAATEARSDILCSGACSTLPTSGDSVENPKANSRVICKRCKTLLGDVQPSGVTKYYFTELLVLPSEDRFSEIPRILFIQSVVTQCLVHLSSTRSTFRFIIQGTDGTVYILIWLLNSDTLLVNSWRNSGVFPFLEHDGSSDTRPLEVQKAAKVLYHPCTKNRNKELTDAWESDAGVRPLTFPPKTCLELLLILAQSNASLPSSLQWMNSFQVAFLKM
uniref:E3 ubiquitin-protein ligase E3D n=1 Tax=Salvator merianae TaxID=96440 RepID=A0A8D0DVE2_SALMN